ncbi:MAG: heavy-metal-associated domain-containing protein [Clostridia bacterium]|nr:heavy-metal-associated domain-containing protein [Clostridia bacterium]
MIFKKIEKTLKVEGMHCQKCVARITDALKTVDGVKKVTIDLEKKTVCVISKNDIDTDVISAVIEKLGFTVIK